MEGGSPAGVCVAFWHVAAVPGVQGDLLFSLPGCGAPPHIPDDLFPSVILCVNLCATL